MILEPGHVSLTCNQSLFYRVIISLFTNTCWFLVSVHAQVIHGAVSVIGTVSSISVQALAVHTEAVDGHCWRSMQRKA